MCKFGVYNQLHAWCQELLDPKQLLCGELVQGKGPVGWPKLRFKDVAKRDVQAIDLPIDLWETLASDRSAWKTNCTEALREGEKLLHITMDSRRERQKARALSPPTDSTYVCGSCHHICRSRIELQSYLRKCLRKCTITNTRLWTRLSDNANTIIIQPYSMVLTFCVTTTYCMLLESCNFWKRKSTSPETITTITKLATTAPICRKYNDL